MQRRLYNELTCMCTQIIAHCYESLFFVIALSPCVFGEERGIHILCSGVDLVFIA